MSREGEVQADTATMGDVAALVAVKQDIAMLDKNKERLELAIKAALGDKGDTLMAGTVKLATWKTQKSSRVDLDLLRTEHGDLVKQFTEVKEIRVLRISK